MDDNPEKDKPWRTVDHKRGRQQRQKPSDRNQHQETRDRSKHDDRGRDGAQGGGQHDDRGRDGAQGRGQTREHQKGGNNAVPGTSGNFRIPRVATPADQKAAKHKWDHSEDSNNSRPEPKKAAHGNGSKEDCRADGLAKPTAIMAGTYAEAASKYRKEPESNEPRPWGDLELRVYKSENHCLPIYRNEWGELQQNLMLETIKYLKETGFKGAHKTKADGTRYDPILKCGQIFCRTDSIEWIQNRILSISGGAFRAWAKDDVANVNLRLFVPRGLEDIPVVDYLHAILLHHPKMPGNQWRHINDFRQLVKNKDGTFPGQKCIIVEVPVEAVEYIKTISPEISKDHWRIDGPIYTVKLTLAKVSDITSRKPQESTSDTELEGIPLPKISSDKTNTNSANQVSDTEQQPSNFHDWTADPKSRHGMENDFDSGDSEMDETEVAVTEEEKRSLLDDEQVPVLIAHKNRKILKGTYQKRACNMVETKGESQILVRLQ